MSIRRITLALVAIAALALAGCATAPPQQAKYQPLLGSYTVNSMVMLDAHNQVLSTRQLVSAAVKQKLAKDGAAFLKTHPDMTKEDLLKMVNVIIDAKLRDHDPLKRMLAGLTDKLTKNLDGKPFLTLADTSMTAMEPLFVPGEHGNDLVEVTDVSYQLHDAQGARTLLASGTYQGKPVHLKLYLLSNDRVFLDMLPFIKDKLGKQSHNLMSFGVDKLGAVLTKRP